MQKPWFNTLANSKPEDRAAKLKYWAFLGHQIAEGKIQASPASATPDPPKALKPNKPDKPKEQKVQTKPPPQPPETPSRNYDAIDTVDEGDIAAASLGF